MIETADSDVRRRAACASDSTAVASCEALSLASWNDENVHQHECQQQGDQRQEWAEQVGDVKTLDG